MSERVHAAISKHPCNKGSMLLQHCTVSVCLYMQGASYTDQAKDWGSRIAGHLSGQAEYLKNKVAGPGTTMVHISCL